MGWLLGLLCLAPSPGFPATAKTLRVEVEDFPVITGARPETRFAAEASGRAYVFLPAGPRTSTEPIQAYVALDFDMPERLCLINIRYRSEDRGSDSFYWSVNDGPWKSFPMRAGIYGKWVWDRVKASLERPGKQRLRLAAREPTRLDVVEITPVELPPAPETRTSWKHATAVRTTGPVTVDGKLDDWRDLDASAGLAVGERDFVLLAKHYFGPEDASAAVYLKWDPTHVYVAAVVQDDVCRNSREGKAGLQEGDGVLICFAPAIPDRRRKAPYPYACIVTPGDFAGVRPQAMRVRGPAARVVRAARRTSFGYVLEFALDLDRWPELQPKQGETVGFELCLYDSDTRFGATRRSSILAWNSLGDRMNAAECGELTFGPAPRKRTAPAPGEVEPAHLLKRPYPATTILHARLPYREGFGFFLDGGSPGSLQAKLRNPKTKTLLANRLLVLADRYLETWHPGAYHWSQCKPGHARQAAKVIDRLAAAYLLTGEDAYGDLATRTTLSVARALPACLAGRPEKFRWLAKAVVAGGNWTWTFCTEKQQEHLLEALRAALPGLQSDSSAVAISVLGLTGLALGEPAVVTAARRRAEAYARSAAGNEPDDTDLTHLVLFEEALRRTKNQRLVVDWKALWRRKLRAVGEPTPAGPAVNPTYVVFLHEPHRMTAAWLASRERDATAAWFRDQCFAVVPASSRDGDEAYTLLWWAEDAVKGRAPGWLAEEAAQVWANRTRERVLAELRAEAKQRAEAAGKKRRVVWRGKPFEPKPAVLNTLDGSILKQFAVSPRPGWLAHHPRLYVTAADRRRWAARLATTHAEAWKRAEAYNRKSVGRAYLPLLTLHGSSSGNVAPAGRSTGTLLGQHALAYGLTHDDLHAEFAKRYLLGMCAEPLWDLRRPDLVHGHALYGAGLAYDQLYHYLMPSERKTALAALQRQGEVMFRTVGHNLKRPGDANNHLWIKLCGLAIAAAAVSEDTPAARHWLDYTRFEFAKILAVLGPDGATPEGFHMYMRYGTEWLLRYLELLYRSTGESLYDHPWLRNNGYCFLYTTMPDGRHVANLGDNPDTGGDASHIAFRYAAQYRDGHFQWLGRRFQKVFSPSSRNVMWSVLWYDPSVPATPPTGLPTWRYFRDMEMVVARSDWTESATCFVFRCGPPMGHHAFAFGATGYGHAHQDQNHFMLFSRGGYLLSDPGYSRYKLTREHNTLLIAGRGQIGEGTTWFHRRLAAGELATLTDFFGSDGYVSVCGEAAAAYWKDLGLKRFRRRALFLDGRLLVVVDRVATTEPRRYDWLLHGPHPFVRKADSVFTTTGEGARLYVKLLAPGEVSAVAEPFTVRRGVVHHPDGSVTIPDKGFPAGDWLKLTPRGPRTEAEFVAVFVPQPKGAALPTASLCAGGTGLQVRDAGREDTVAVASRDGRLAAALLRGRGARGWVAERGARIDAFALEKGTRLAFGGRLRVESTAPVSLAVVHGRLTGEAESATRLRLQVENRTWSFELKAGVTVRNLVPPAGASRLTTGPRTVLAGKRGADSPPIAGSSGPRARRGR